MEIGIKGINLIKHWEGWEPTAYNDGTDVLTIGYGHTNDEKYPVRWGMTITKAKGEEILKHDLTEAEASVNNLVNTNLINQEQYDALVSFTYNSGAGAMADIAQYINKKEFDKATYWMSKYVKGGIPLRVLQGLINRRNAEIKLFNEHKPTSNGWNIIKKDGHFTTDRKLDINNEPTIKSPAVNYYDKGQKFTYDGYVKNDGYVYLTYPSYSGIRRYIAVGPDNNNVNDTWGKGFFN